MQVYPNLHNSNLDPIDSVANATDASPHVDDTGAINFSGVYVGIFAKEAGIAFLQRLQDIAVDVINAIIRTIRQNNPDHPKLNHLVIQGIHSIQNWDSHLKDVETRKVTQKFKDIVSLYMDVVYNYVEQLTASRSSSMATFYGLESGKQTTPGYRMELTIKLPAFSDFLHTFLTLVARADYMTGGGFFNKDDYIQRRLFLMDAIRNALSHVLKGSIRAVPVPTERQNKAGTSQQATKQTTNRGYPHNAYDQPKNPQMRERMGVDEPRSATVRSDSFSTVGSISSINLPSIDTKNQSNHYSAFSTARTQQQQSAPPAAVTSLPTTFKNNTHEGLKLDTNATNGVKSKERQQIEQPQSFLKETDTDQMSGANPRSAVQRVENAKMSQTNSLLLQSRGRQSFDDDILPERLESGVVHDGETDDDYDDEYEESDDESFQNISQPIQQSNEPSKDIPKPQPELRAPSPKVTETITEVLPEDDIKTVFLVQSSNASVSRESKVVGTKPNRSEKIGISSANPKNANNDDDEFSQQENESEDSDSDDEVEQPSSSSRDTNTAVASDKTSVENVADKLQEVTASQSVSPATDQKITKSNRNPDIKPQGKDVTNVEHSVTPIKDESKGNPEITSKPRAGQANKTANGVTRSNPIQIALSNTPKLSISTTAKIPPELVKSKKAESSAPVVSSGKPTSTTRRKVGK